MTFSILLFLAQLVGPCAQPYVTCCPAISWDPPPVECQAKGNCPEYYIVEVLRRGPRRSHPIETDGYWTRWDPLVTVTERRVNLARYENSPIPEWLTVRVRAGVDIDCSLPQEQNQGCCAGRSSGWAACLSEPSAQVSACVPQSTCAGGIP